MRRKTEENMRKIKALYESGRKEDSLVYAEDKRAVKPYRYKGKTYTDVTDLFAGR